MRENPIALFTAFLAALLAVRYSVSDFLVFLFRHTLYKLRFTSTAFATSSFHHHVSLCLDRPFVLPHTSSATSNKQVFKPFHTSSTSLSLSFLPAALASTCSPNRLRTPSSLNLHTLHLLTNTCFLCLIHSCTSSTQTTSLCCRNADSPGITLAPLTMAHSFLLT